MISIYKNESFLIEDKVKEYFKEKYKHLELSIMYEEINDLITGYYITIKENKLMIQRSNFISAEDFESYKDAINKIMNFISLIFKDLIFNYYHYTA